MIRLMQQLAEHENDRARASWGQGRPQSRRKRGSPEGIHAAIELASGIHGVHVEDILGEDRSAKIAEARQAAMLFAHEDGNSTVQIGEYMGRDPSTVNHGIKAARKRLDDFCAQTIVFKTTRLGGR